MEENKIQDERILLEKKEIQSRGYEWIIYILTITIIVQQFFMQAPFSQFAVEIFLLIGCAIYNVIANYRRGIDIWNPCGSGKGKIFISTIVSGAACAIALAFLSGDPDESIFSGENPLHYIPTCLAKEPWWPDIKPLNGKVHELTLQLRDRMS